MTILEITEYRLDVQSQFNVMNNKNDTPIISDVSFFITPIDIIGIFINYKTK